jgi:hypothetical protein
MIITRILEPSGTNAQIEVRDHGFPKEADMASLQSNHRPRTVPPAAAPGHRDRWRRLDVLASESSGWYLRRRARVDRVDHLHDPNVSSRDALVVEC